jgi:hypothetical protein
MIVLGSNFEYSPRRMLSNVVLADYDEVIIILNSRVTVSHSAIWVSCTDQKEFY